MKRTFLSLFVCLVCGLTLAAPVLYCGAKTGHIPLWAGFVVYGGFAILCSIDMAWRNRLAARFGAGHGIDRAT